MIFSIILSVVTIVAAVVFFVVFVVSAEDWAELLGIVCVVLAAIFVSLGLKFGLDAKKDKALIQAHLENPTNYTYSQLADHNEFVTKAKVWQGTIFSFYNDVDLQTIDIDSVGQKVIIKSNHSCKEEK